jgi:Tfp pilus assembly protein PilO
MKFTESQKSKMLIIGFLGAVVMVVTLYFHFIIGRGIVRDAKVESTQLNTEIADARQELKEIRELMAQEGAMEEQRAMIQEVVKRLPNSPDAPGFLMALVSILRTTHIIQEVVRPDRPQNRRQYTEIPYSVTAHGRYHELGQFLTLIEQNPRRFMRVKGFKVENNLERPSIHPISMEIATFMFNDTP